MATADIGLQSSATEELTRIASQTRVLLSMPRVDGITPRVLVEKGKREGAAADQGMERCYGVFRLDEVGLPALDHGLLYGDAVFEGVLIAGGQLFQWREHLRRLYESANSLHIHVPYTPAELTERVLEAVNDPGLSAQGHSYIRLVVTRGMGDLGINPAKCAGSTVYCIVSKVQLFPEILQKQGVRLSIARDVRRSGADVLDPRIKSCNYVNNVLALLETEKEKTHETVMLTRDGFVAEATTDNLFVVCRKEGWQSDPSRVTVLTPSPAYCLNGITRSIVMGHARKLGFRVEETASMLPVEFAGKEREMFLTGTAAGMVPVIMVDGRQVGDGQPGPVTGQLRQLLYKDMTDPAMGLPQRASREEIRDYLSPMDDELAPHGVSPVSIDLVTGLFERVDSRRWDDLRDVFCDDVVYERPGYEPLVGFARVMQFYRHERVIVSGKHMLENIVINENGGACWGRFAGMHKNNSAIDERFADVYTFKNGKIQTRKSYFFRPAV